MSGRPAKRPADAPDPADEVASPTSSGKVKLPRLDKQEDFSSLVKNRLQSYTRTGQACDRCKVRKIRCDALPEGCSHCVNQNLDCYVTDRVTGRTERRGYLQELEREKKDMMSHVRDLEKLLGDNGIEVRPWNWSPYAAMYPPPPAMTYDDVVNAMDDPPDKESWAKAGSVWFKSRGPHKPATTQIFPRSFPRSMLESRPADNHLGVGSDSAPLSSMQGTQLSILGTTIDITSFDAPDMDEPQPDAKVAQPLYNKSVQAFLQSSMNINPPLNVELPSRNDAFTYSEWYFLMIFPFLPVLHKPTFMNMLTRIYDEPGFEPSIPELVMAHMVFAAIYFQYGIRNWEQPEHRAQLNELSNKHYHFALSKFFDLASTHTVSSVQAMAMIAAHSRSFPKPGCGALVASFAFNRAIDLNLHRAAKMPGETTNLENEIRKRAWWTILCVYVTLNGRLGRPMPITVEEYDVGFPEPIPDELLKEDGVDTSRTGQCLYQVGLAGFRIVPLFMEMYSNIYCVKRDPTSYVAVVNALEEQLRLWRESLPDSLQLGQPGQLEHEGQVYALYTELFAIEFQLCLRHPGVAMTSDPKMCAENSRICEETSASMLKVVKTLLKLKSLDTTWYQMSVYAAAIFSTLVAHWERRFEVIPSQIAVLREEMKDWLNILIAMAALLGSGTRISNEIGVIVERTIGWIESVHIHKEIKLSSQAGKRGLSASSPYPGSSIAPSHGVPPANGSGHAEPITKAYYHDSAAHNGGASYPPLAYPEQTSNGNMGGPAPYEASNGFLYTGATQAVGSADHPPAETNPLVAFASQATQHVADPSGPAAADMLWRQSTGQSNTWHDWTAAIADSQDRYSANALLTLGGGARDPNAATETTAVTDMAGVVATPAGQWPMLLFDGPGTSAAP